MKRILLLAFSACTFAIGANAQDEQTPDNQKKLEAFKHLDLSLNAGSTGIGLELASPIGKSLQVRAGYAIMPRFHVDMNFHVQVGDDPSASQSKFNRLSGLLENVTGYKVDDRVKMIGTPTFHQLSVMVDVMPFKNKNWHFTAGFFYGPKQFAKAYNATEDMPSLVAVGIYNNLWGKVAASPISHLDTEEERWDYFFGKSAADLLSEISLLKTLGIDVSEIEALQNIEFDPDDNILLKTYKRIYNYGAMGIHVGDYKEDVVDEQGNVVHKKGDPYMMVPNNESMVKADWIVDRFRPYLGFGYSGRLAKNDDRWKIGFDCGAMFWGGTPRIITHEGVDLCSDVEDISGDVGRKVRFFKQFKAYPVLNLRITRRLF